jgi:CubicO group peptidase (beta-lactamase class C family)
MLSRRDLTSMLVLAVTTPTLTACATRAQTPDAAGAAIVSASLLQTRTPGVAALVIKDFRAQPELVAGVRTLGAADQVATGDRWNIGSDGKAMTATMIGRLVEKGVLSWDRPLDQMLPDLAAAMHPVYRGATLPDLLSHRAALPENAADMDFIGAFFEDRATLPAQRLRYISAALREAPIGPPRAEQSYSNTGLLIAAVAAERATNRAFEDLIAAEVFAPLRMASVSFDQLGRAGEPNGHIDGRIADRARDANPRMFLPAGGMRMSLPDWARFCIDQMRGEHGQGKLLDAATYRFPHAGQGESGSALGWGAAPNPMGLQGPALTHAGTDGNWYALVALFPNIGAGVLIAANAGESMDGDKVAFAAIRPLASAIVPAAS